MEPQTANRGRLGSGLYMANSRALRPWTWVATACLCFCGSGRAEDTNTFEIPDDAFHIPLWEPSFNVRAGFGYKDNVLLSGTNPEDSPFWTAGGDVMLFRLPTGGWWFHCFASADNVGYFDSSTEVDNEQVAVVATQLARDLGRDWRTGLGFNYLFQNQVFDVTATQTNQFTIGKVLGHNVTGRWFARKETKSWWAEAEANLTRQWLDEPLDHFWQTGPRVVAGHTYGREADVSLSYQWLHTVYDTRPQVDPEGYAVPDTELRFQTHAVELAWRHAWDQRRQWQTTAKAAFEANQDNGSGYFDYWLYRLAAQAKYRLPAWEFSAHARVGYYDYPVQTVSPADPALRHKTLLALGARAERSLAKHWKIFATYAYDRSLSNLDFDHYQANTASAGVNFDF